MSDSSVGVLGVYIMAGLVCGFITMGIAVGRRRSYAWFFAGFFFGPIGLLVVALVLKPGRVAPAGMRAATCPRCNAEQNVSASAESYECWQCKLVSPVPTPIQKPYTNPFK